MSRRLVLQNKLDSAAAADLRDSIVAAQGQDIVLDGTGVTLLGGLCLEVLMSARHLWAKDGKSLSLENSSKELIDALGRFGLSVEYFEGSTV